MSLCVHNAARFNSIQVDPTHTQLIRRQFRAEMLRRMTELRKAVWEFMVTLDALGLADKSVVFTGLEATIVPGEGRLGELTVHVQPRQFKFRTNPDKVKAFREWLQTAIDAKVLSAKDGFDPAKPWTYKYIESAYRKGRTNAFIAAQKANAVAGGPAFDKARDAFLRSSFNQPETLAKMQLMATRAFEDLRGVTSEMATQMNRILAQGIVDGKGPRQMAKEMSDTIGGLTRKRALLIAQTETIAAHAQGQLDSFKDLGIGKLGVKAEWSTAGDDRVCPRCAALEGKTFTLKQAQGLIPLHPRCRCSWIPSIPDPRKKKR